MTARSRSVTSGALSGAPDDLARHDAGLFRALHGRLSPTVRQSFTTQQIEALRVAAGELYQGAHALDMRLSLPLGFKRRLYLVLLAGQERRSRARLWPSCRLGNRLSYLTLLSAGTALAFFALWHASSTLSG